MTNEQFDNARAALRVALADYKAAPAATLTQWRAQARLEAACAPELIERLLRYAARYLRLRDAPECVFVCFDNNTSWRPSGETLDAAIDAMGEE